jgi:hypothetical protein
MGFARPLKCARKDLRAYVAEGGVAAACALLRCGPGVSCAGGRSSSPLACPPSRDRDRASPGARPPVDAPPLGLQIHYNRDTNTVTCRITAASRTAHAAAVISLGQARQRREQQKRSNKDQESPETDEQPGPMLVVPRQDSNLRHTV